jgi:hypothetical protein
VKLELRAMTKRPRDFDSSVMTSSAMPSGEILLLRVAAHVVERQHRDRRSLGQCQSGHGSRRRRFSPHPIHPDHLSDVLDLLIAKVVERQRQLVADVIACRGRNADGAGIGERLQSGRDVHPVAKQIGAVNHDIADMHADPQLHRLIGAVVGIFCGYRDLHGDCALHSIDRAGEIRDDAVASGVEDATPMRRDQPVDDGAARLQPGERTDLVARHQPAVAGNVRGEDRGQFALYRVDRHAWLLPTRV